MRAPYIEISGSLLTGDNRGGAEGTDPAVDRVERWQFLVESVEANGVRFCMWVGTSYEDAILDAEELADQFGWPVIDLVLRGHT